MRRGVYSLLASQTTLLPALARALQQRSRLVDQPLSFRSAEPLAMRLEQAAVVVHGVERARVRWAQRRVPAWHLSRGVLQVPLEVRRVQQPLVVTRRRRFLRSHGGSWRHGLHGSRRKWLEDDSLSVVTPS